MQGLNGLDMAKTLATEQCEQSGQKVADKNMTETSQENEDCEGAQYSIFCDVSEGANKTVASEMLPQET